MQDLVPVDVVKQLFLTLNEGLKSFCLERWQSLHENYVRIQLSESGVAPLSLAELEDLGLDLTGTKELRLGYGWTKGSVDLRKAIAGLYNADINEEMVLVGNGSAETNFVAVWSLVKPGDKVLVDIPNYMQVPGLLRWVGANVIEVRREPPDWRYPVEKVISLMEEEKPSTVFITDPNNPTGHYMNRSDLERLVEAARETGTRLVFDEVYWGSERCGSRPSALEVGEPGLVTVVSGFSKVYGLPGLRVGWLVSDVETVNRAWAFKDYTTIAISRLSDYVATKVLGNRDIVEKLWQRAREITRRDLEVLSILLSGSPGSIEPDPPCAGAYALVKVPTKDTLGLSYILYSKYSILVNPGECFEIPGYLRVGAGLDPEIYRGEAAAFAKALREVLG